MSLIRYVHGSEDSVDLDVYYVIDTLPSFSECQKFCSADPEENRNIIVIQGGIVTQCFKGTVDEINNGLIATYPLHPQDYPLLVNRAVPRDIGLKMIRVVRCLLSYCSRTEYRAEVKAALRSPNWEEKIRVLRSIDFENIKDYGKAPLQEVYKVFAFQLGQVFGLLAGLELYTKSEVGHHFPRLKFYLRRNDLGSFTIARVIREFIGELEAMSARQEESCIVTEFGKYDLTTESRV